MLQSVVLESWERALAAFADGADRTLRWMLVGSAATAVHGVAVCPGDVDILVHPETSDEGMHSRLSFLSPHLAGSAGSDDLAGFLSTRGRPLLATGDGSWLFGRWFVDGCALEVARIREAVADDLLLETLGTAVWAHHEAVCWRGRFIPVVPLEVQLATIVARDLRERERVVRLRLAEISARETLLERAFAARGLSLPRLG